MPSVRRHLELTGAFFLVLVACTNDYDQFNFNGSGGSPATGGGGTSNTGGDPQGAGPQGGGGETTTNGGAPQGGGGSTTTDGGGGTGGTGGTGGDGGGGMPPTGDTVPCGGEECDLDAGEVCCYDVDNGDVACTQAGACNDATLACNGPQDCNNGDECCFVFNGQDLEGTECRDGCGGNSPEICDPDLDPDTCPGNDDCIDSMLLPDGWFRCG